MTRRRESATIVRYHALLRSLGASEKLRRMSRPHEILRTAVASPASVSPGAVDVAVDTLAQSHDASDLSALVEFFSTAVDRVERAATPAALERWRAWRDRAAARLARQPLVANDEAYRAAHRRYERQVSQRAPLEEFIAVTDGLIVELSDAVARYGADPPGYPHATLALATVANWNRLAKSGQLAGAYEAGLPLDRPEAAFGRVADRLRRLEELYATYFRDAAPEAG